MLADPASRGRAADPKGLAFVLRTLQGSAGNHAVARLVQPRASARTLQRRLVASGSDADFDRFRTLVEPAMGVLLARDTATNVVTMIGSLVDPATSPALLDILGNIIDDPVQDAEVHFGEHQPRVAVGMFPEPPDMTGATEQRIDLDDIENIEAGAPGNGIAKFAHEIRENYVAHGALAAAGVNQFPAAHEAGVAAESRVAGELVGPGDRVADRDAIDPADANKRTRVQDFQFYYLVFDLTRTPATNDFAVSNARQAAKTQVSQRTVDSFANNSDAFPGGGAASAGAVAADLAVAAHPQATVLIEGFTDSTGNAGINDPLSRRRAESARAAIIAAGAPVGPGSFEVRGRGANNFVAGNATAADRARNRRVVITVTEPAPP
jgi:outer membrane protein OmpA-like peptidoglycan-associated protein